ncbi:bacterio-opsin activator domain-containing protein [Natrinema versiforme]|uniref:Bacterio-opsin activator n=1 Tax=Natrinema versiforme JCM 10478 TaxID=1227496 RepID=L9YBA9_9EURY|nr:bacterio-opsin activator domain-containing protein [Natrinema versiforme]ELY70921.1 bacterio-opsin activator [Natrinema versiforme JCM 10478]
MDDVDTERGDNAVDDPAAAVRALEYVVDPVVAVVEGTITYANEAARDAFELGDADRDAATALGARWDRLAAAIDETTVGTARRVDFDSDQGSVRLHRGANGATITFDRDGSESHADDATGSPSGPSDRLVKDRAIEEAPVGITISDPDREDNPLVYVNEAYEEITGYQYDDVVGRNCRFLQGPDSDEDAIAEMAAAIDEDRPITVELTNYRKDGTEFWNEVTIAPIRDDEGRVTNYVGFQNDVTSRKEAELALERRTEELEYILDRVEGLIQDVTAVVAGSTDRAALEREVCERIAAEDAYDGAWIGERNPATDTIEIRSSVGDGPERDRLEAGIDHPAAETVATDEPAVDTVDGTTRVALPLSYNGIEYGVLTVRADRDHAADDRETVILSALARAVASGINARETSRVLATDAVVAVELELTDRDLAPVALSAAADCRLEYRRSVHRSDDETASLFTVDGASADEIAAAAADLPDVDCRIIVERDEGCLVELTSATDLVGWLSGRGARTRTIESESGRARVTVEIPRSASVRSVVEAVEDRYEGTDVISFQQREREDQTRQEFAARLEESLTDRQFGALQRAYLGGYFEWPRPTTGEELAQSMGVSRPTFHEHLRTAEAKLCQAFFGDA